MGIGSDEMELIWWQVKLVMGDRVAKVTSYEIRMNYELGIMKEVTGTTRCSQTHFSLLLVNLVHVIVWSRRFIAICIFSYPCFLPIRVL